MPGINRSFFFTHARLTLFDGGFKQSQVAGITAILDHWESKHSADDDRWLAYLLATAHHETGRTMQPIKEWGGDSYFTKRYDPPTAGKNPGIAKQLGNIKPGDGALFCGRGFVQLTGRRNYADWSQRLGIDLIGKPALCMELETAVRILVEGSIKGTFTGKKLGHYIAGSKADWRNARRVINGLDKADLIQSYALRYYGAIAYTT